MKVLVGYEVSLGVESYEGDFERCQKDLEGARRNLIAELDEALKHRVAYEIKKIEFLEFDSSNPGHASGYFYCVIELDHQQMFNHLMGC